MSAPGITFLQFLNGVKAALDGLRLNQVPGFEGQPPEVKAFGEVRVYAHEGIGAAIADTLTFEDRLAFVIPSESRFDSALEGRELKSRRTLGCMLLLADRVYGDRVAAATGNEETPGIIALADLVVTHLHGADLGLVGVCVTPGDGQPFTLSKDDQENLPGREVWAQEWTTPAGNLRTALARSGTVR